MNERRDAPMEKKGEKIRVHNDSIMYNNVIIDAYGLLYSLPFPPGIVHRRGRQRFLRRAGRYDIRFVYK